MKLKGLLQEMSGCIKHASLAAVIFGIDYSVVEGAVLLSSVNPHFGLSPCQLGSGSQPAQWACQRGPCVLRMGNGVPLFI